MLTITKNETTGLSTLVGKQGTTWTFFIDVWDDEVGTIASDLSGYFARGNYKADYATETQVSIQFVCTIASNRVSVLASADSSSATDLVSGVFDIEVFNADESSVERVAEGTLTMTEEVTR